VPSAAPSNTGFSIPSEGFVPNNSNYNGKKNHASTTQQSFSKNELYQQKSYKAWNPKGSGAGAASYYQRAPATKQSVFKQSKGVEHFFKPKNQQLSK
jgi:trimethylamine:corrinoid methyltransferase-like protein